jgi:SAM-dependent methyltransferase
LPFALLAFTFTVTAAFVSRRLAPLAGSAVLLFCVGFFVHTTRRGKFLVWHDLIDDLRLHGTERILDLGCGRGAVLLSVARRLTTGHAFGIDIWSRTDQGGLTFSFVAKLMR